MIEYLHNSDLESLHDYPFCIIGSGAAGITLAIALSRKGHRVLLIEGGDWQEISALDDAYSGQANPPHSATTEYRHQRFGGTTHLWGGRCVPYDAIDFESRSHIPNSGWPISYSEFSAYYPAAMEYCDAGLADFSVGALSSTNTPMFEGLPKLKSDLVEMIERYSLPTDFGKKYRKELSDSSLVKVLLQARCTGLSVSNSGSKVNSINLTNGERTFQINAKQVIICGGGIESTRLLLATAESVPNWERFENSLGKYYACHFDLIFGELAFTRKKPFFDFQKTNDGIYARRKLHFSSQFQKDHQLLNSTFRLHFPAYADARHGSGVLSTIYLAKFILASEHQNILNHGSTNDIVKIDNLAHVLNAITDIKSVISFGYDWLFKIRLAQRKLPYTLVPNRNGTYPIEFNSEQIPDQNNQISLLPDRDKFGIKRVSINWKITDTDIESGIESFMQLQRLLSSVENCQFNFDNNELKEKMQNALPVGGHHIGTTRMGQNDQNSVVDKNCKVHGVDNLYVASSSVFPTSSHANPTLTIVALSLRLADYLDLCSTQ